MGILKNLFSKKTSAEDQIGNLIKSMVEIAMEYVNFNEKEIETVYIFATIEESQYVAYSYKINGHYVQPHQVNNYLTDKVSIESEQQIAVLDICQNDLNSIKNIFKSENREMFKHLKITYDVKTKKMDSSFDYKTLLIGTDLNPQDVEKDWIESLK